MKTTRPELSGNVGMVSSTQWLATGTGMSVLERGGNAFDAAVAAGLVLQVVEPHLNGPGGEVPIIFHAARDGAVRVIAGQGTAPAGASIARFRDLGYERIPGTGPMGACVPGAFGAWMRLLRDYGTWSIGPILEYAIGYAREGFVAPPRMVETIAAIAPVFEQHWPTSADVYLHPRVSPGAIARNPDLARTFERLVDAGESGHRDRDDQIQASTDAFYRGFVADAIDRFMGEAIPDADGRVSLGLLTGADMASWEATVEDAVRFEYRGRTVCKTGPWGQGPVLLQHLAVLEGLDLAGMGHLSADWIHTVVEGGKLAFADRDAWYGDPDFTDVPIAALLDRAYATERRGLIGPRADATIRPGHPGGRLPLLPAGWTADGIEPARAGLGEPGMASRLGRGDTCHIDVVDRFGNMVAAMPSGAWLQSSSVVPGLGFPLGTRAQMFWLDERHPNSLAPGKRPRTTLSPTLVLEGSEPVLAFGSPGGDYQDQWGLAFLLAVIDHGLGLQAAIDAPSFYSDHLIGSFDPRPFEARSLHVERRIDVATIRDLEARGHQITVHDPWSLGWLCAVGRDPRTGLLLAASNPRDGQGFAVGR